MSQPSVFSLLDCIQLASFVIHFSETDKFVIFFFQQIIWHSSPDPDFKVNTCVFSTNSQQIESYTINPQQIEQLDLELYW